MSLPSPYYQDDSVTLYHGDCRKIIPRLGRFDLVLTDPPYLICAGSGCGAFGERAHLMKTGGFTDGGCEYSFLHAVENWFCFCSRQQLQELLKFAERCHRWNLLTWCKPNPVPTCSNKYLPDLEFIVHGFSKGRLFGDMSVKSQFMVCPCGNKETSHPNEKPIALISKLVILGTQQGEVVLDPFAGSGTTGRACKDLGRKCVMIEQDPDYCEVIARRMGQEVLAL